MKFRKLSTISRIVLGAFLILSLGSCAGDSGDTQERMVAPQAGANVLLITIDTTRADHIGCYGGDPEVTPVLDSLSERGVTFDATQAAAPITLPSHATMLSGQFVYKHGMRNNGMFAMSEDTETLATVFSRAGYATGAFVSASVLASRYGLDHDFDVYDDDLSQSTQMFSRGVPARRGDLTLANAIEWMNELPDDKPFFCWLHLYDPHAPYDPPPEFRKRFPTDPYSGEIAFTDKLIGDMVAYLEGRDLMDSTFLSVISDHGEAFGEHGERTHATLLHQATTWVPWIITGPGVPAGIRVKPPTSGADIAPTHSALVGLQPPNKETADGVDVFESLDDQREIITEILLPQYQYGWSPLLGIRRGKWQLIDGSYAQLFNLKEDPRELTDVAAREKLTADDLKERLDTLTSASSDDQARLSLSRSEIDQLEALGYAGGEAAARIDPLDPRDMIGAHVNLETARDMVTMGNFDMALEALGVALAEDEGNVAILNERARVYLRTGNLDAARADFSQMLFLDPENAPTYHGLAQLELQDQNFAEALKLAELGTTKRGAFESLSIDKVKALIGLGRREEAEQFISERLAENPTDPDLLGFQGELARFQGDYAKAEDYLRKAIAADALHVSSRFRLAQLLTNTGRKLEAVDVLSDLLRIQPGNAVALGLIGDIRIDDPEFARPYLEEAIRLNPTLFVALVDLGRCYISLGLAEKAEAMLRRAQDIHPQSQAMRNNLAISLIIQNRLDEAIEILRDLLSDYPDFAEARNNLALSLGRAGRIDEAETEARKAISSRKGFIDPVLTLVSILLDSGRAEESVSFLERFVGIQPEHADFPTRYGLSLIGAGRAAESIPWLEKALEITRSSDPEVLLGLGLAKEETGASREAQTLYERAAQIAPTAKMRNEAQEGITRLVNKRR